MTEPVAYIYKDNNSDNRGIQFDEPSSMWDSVTPLYTAEQLRPRVKMTQAEFDEFKNLFEVVDYASIALATIQHVKDDFNKLGLKVYSGTVNERIKKENEFNVLWANYDPDNPEETIEIIPEMKWFVRSKERYQPDMDQGIAESGYLYLTQGDIYSIEYYETTSFKDDAQQFDTKEEAEKWTNPLTEAVKLPVEDE